MWKIVTNHGFPVPPREPLVLRTARLSVYLVTNTKGTNDSKKTDATVFLVSFVPFVVFFSAAC
jgi:hypothetical protein